MENNAQQTLSDPVGQLLKEARAAKGLTLKEIASTLRIGIRKLTSLEEDEDLTCDVYTLGFLRTYARHLGLNDNELCQRFKESTRPADQTPIAFPAPTAGKGMPNFRILGFSLIALLLILGGWTWLARKSPPDISYPEVSFVEPLSQPNVKVETSPPQNTPVIEHLPTTVVIPKETPPPAEPLSSSVTLKVLEDAWIEVKDKEGNIILSRVLKGGEEHEFKDPHNLLLKTGNAGGTQLISSRKTQEVLGSAGEVKANIPLDPEKWVDPNENTP